MNDDAIFGDTDLVEIAAAVEHLGLDDARRRALIEAVQLLALPEAGVDPAPERRAWETLAAERADFLAALERVTEHVDRRLRDAPDPDRLEGADAFCGALKRPLTQLARRVRTELKDAERIAAFHIARARAAPARKHAREALFDQIARTWEEFGGTVDRGRHYRAFFRAVVMPIARSAYGRMIGLEERPEPEYPDRDEVFVRHVRSQKERRGAN